MDLEPRASDGEATRDDAFKQPYLCVDATGVLVLAKKRCRVGHFWVTVAPDKHVLFAYSSAATTEVRSMRPSCRSWPAAARTRSSPSRTCGISQCWRRRAEAALPSGAAL